MAGGTISEYLRQHPEQNRAVFVSLQYLNRAQCNVSGNV
jgi:hypothetical protein